MNTELWDRRLAVGLSRRALAEVLGIDQMTLYRRETGEIEWGNLQRPIQDAWITALERAEKESR